MKLDPNRLTPTDARFLHAETPAEPMHTAALTVFAATQVRQDQLLEHVASRLYRAPRFRQRLQAVPLGQGRPVWVDDPHFDLRFHVRFTGLARPRTRRELNKLVSRLMSLPLDRTRPLWELWVIDLPNGQRAVLHKAHHCLVDGFDQLELAGALLDGTPHALPISPSHNSWVPEAQKGKLALLGGALLARATDETERRRSLRALLRPERALVKRGARLLERGIDAITGAADARRQSPLQGRAGCQRRFDTVTLRLDDVESVARHFDCTVNDVVLALVAGGVRELLLGRNESIGGLLLRAAIPFDTGRTTNTARDRFSTMMGTLPVGVEGAEERLECVRDTMRCHSDRAHHSALAGGGAEEGAPTLLAPAARALVGHRSAPVAVAHSATLGPELYLRGARLLEAYPCPPLHGSALVAIGTLAHGNTLAMGISADHDLLPDLSVLVSALPSALEQLLSIVEGAGRTTRRARRIDDNEAPSARVI